MPNRQDLKKLSDDFSVDFAALYLADRIARVPANRRFSAAFRQAYEYTRKAVSEGRMKVPGAAEYDVLFVPTYLYKRLTLTGADLAVPRAALQNVGFHCFFVETFDDGSIETNAEIVTAAIGDRATSGRRLIVISASKSGAEVALALTKLGPARTRHVAAWINAVGALQGTPMVDDKLLPDLEFLVGKVNPAGGRKYGDYPEPTPLRIVQHPSYSACGQLLRDSHNRKISFFGRKGFFPLRKYGPNDGSLLLADMIFPGGLTLPRLGSDHMQMNNNLDIVTVALIMTVVDWLKSDDYISPLPSNNLTRRTPERPQDSENDVSANGLVSSP